MIAPRVTAAPAERWPPQTGTPCALLSGGPNVSCDQHLSGRMPVTGASDRKLSCLSLVSPLLDLTAWTLVSSGVGRPRASCRHFLAFLTLRAGNNSRCRRSTRAAWSGRASIQASSPLLTRTTLEFASSKAPTGCAHVTAMTCEAGHSGTSLRHTDGAWFSWMCPLRALIRRTGVGRSSDGANTNGDGLQLLTQRNCSRPYAVPLDHILLRCQ